MQSEKFLGEDKKIGRPNSGVSFEDFKKSLGQKSVRYSDAQIEHMRISAEYIADSLFNAWLYRRNIGNVSDTNHGDK